jgi:hypothetical protein
VAVYVPLALLLVAAAFGAIDVVLFHLWQLRLYKRRQSRREEAAHLARGLLVPTLVLLLARGAPFRIVVALFVLDIANSIYDMIVEPDSRAPYGVPPVELAVHFVGITLMGGAFATYVFSAGAPPIDPLLLLAARATALGGYLLVAVETALTLQSARA